MMRDMICELFVFIIEGYSINWIYTLKNINVKLNVFEYVFLFKTIIIWDERLYIYLKSYSMLIGGWCCILY